MEITTLCRQPKCPYSVPKPWTAEWDEEDEVFFYFNNKTGESTYDPPEGYVLLGNQLETEEETSSCDENEKKNTEDEQERLPLGWTRIYTKDGKYNGFKNIITGQESSEFPPQNSEEEELLLKLELLLHYSKENKNRSADCAGKTVVVLLGKTASGKTTLIHYLLGRSFYEVDNPNGTTGKVLIPNCSEEELEKLRPGNSQTQSETRYTVAVEYGKKEKEMMLLDTAGFGDSNGFIIELSNMVGLRQSTAQAKSVLFIAVINMLEFQVSKSSAIKELLKMIPELFEDSESIIKENLLAFLVRDVMSTKVKIKNSFKELEREVKHGKHIVSMITQDLEKQINPPKRRPKDPPPLDKVHSIDPQNPEQVRILEDIIIKTPKRADPGECVKMTLSSAAEAQVMQLQIDLQKYVKKWTHPQSRNFRSLSRAMKTLMELEDYTLHKTHDLFQTVEKGFSEFLDKAEADCKRDFSYCIQQMNIKPEFIENISNYVSILEDLMNVEISISQITEKLKERNKKFLEWTDTMMKECFVEKHQKNWKFHIYNTEIENETSSVLDFLSSLSESINLASLKNSYFFFTKETLDCLKELEKKLNFEEPELLSKLIIVLKKSEKFLQQHFDKLTEKVDCCELSKKYINWLENSIRENHSCVENIPEHPEHIDQNVLTSFDFLKQYSKLSELHQFLSVDLQDIFQKCSSKLKNISCSLLDNIDHDLNDDKTGPIPAHERQISKVERIRELDDSLRQSISDRYAQTMASLRLTASTLVKQLQDCLSSNNFEKLGDIVQHFESSSWLDKYTGGAITRNKDAAVLALKHHLELQQRKLENLWKINSFEQFTVVYNSINQLENTTAKLSHELQMEITTCRNNYDQKIKEKCDEINQFEFLPDFENLSRNQPDEVYCVKLEQSFRALASLHEICSHIFGTVVNTRDELSSKIERKFEGYLNVLKYVHISPTIVSKNEATKFFEKRNMILQILKWCSSFTEINRIQTHLTPEPADYSSACGYITTLINLLYRKITDASVSSLEEAEDYLWILQQSSCLVNHSLLSNFILTIIANCEYKIKELFASAGDELSASLINFNISRVDDLLNDVANNTNEFNKNFRKVKMFTSEQIVNLKNSFYSWIPSSYDVNESVLLENNLVQLHLHIKKLLQIIQSRDQKVSEELNKEFVLIKEYFNEEIEKYGHWIKGQVPIGKHDVAKERFNHLSTCCKRFDELVSENNKKLIQEVGTAINSGETELKHEIQDALKKEDFLRINSLFGNMSVQDTVRSELQNIVISSIGHKIEEIKRKSDNGEQDFDIEIETSQNDFDQIEEPTIKDAINKRIKLLKAQQTKKNDDFLRKIDDYLHKNSFTASRTLFEQQQNITLREKAESKIKSSFDELLGNSLMQQNYEDLLHDSCLKLETKKTLKHQLKIAIDMSESFKDTVNLKKLEKIKTDFLQEKEENSKSVFSALQSLNHHQLQTSKKSAETYCHCLSVLSLFSNYMSSLKEQESQLLKIAEQKKRDYIHNIDHALNAKQLIEFKDLFTTYQHLYSVLENLLPLREILQKKTFLDDLQSVSDIINKTNNMIEKWSSQTRKSFEEGINDELQEFLSKKDHLEKLAETIPGINVKAVSSNFFTNKFKTIEEEAIKAWKEENYKKVSEHLTFLEKSRDLYKNLKIEPHVTVKKSIMKSVETEFGELKKKEIKTALDIREAASKLSKLRELGEEIPSILPDVQKRISQYLDSVLSAENNEKKKFIFGNLHNCLENQCDIHGQRIIQEVSVFEAELRKRFNDFVSRLKPNAAIMRFTEQIYQSGKWSPESSIKEHADLLNLAETFITEFEEILKEWVFRKKDLSSLIRKIQQWKPLSLAKMSQNLPLILAQIFALWSLKRSFQNDGQTDSLLRPHSVQVLSLLKIFGSGKRENMMNTLIQIGTGEGKSIILGVACILFAMLGYSVDCISYTPYLSKRDDEAFHDLFVAIGVRDRIHYSTIEALCEREINRKGNVRKSVSEFLNGSSVTSTNKDLNAQQQLQKVLLIDEVDVFLSDNFLGQNYTPSAFLKTPDIFEIIEYIWKQGDHPDFNINKIRELPAYRKLVQKFPDFKEIFDLQLCQMVSHRNSFNDPPYHLDTVNNIIGYKAHELATEYDYGVYFPHNTTFAYMHELDKNRIPLSTVKERVGFSLMCGDFSFAEIPSKYDIVSGVTGTLPTSDVEMRLLSKYNIRCLLKTPSVYGDSNLRFFSSDVVLCSDFEVHLLKVKEVVKREAEKGRPVLVFFSEPAMLNTFATRFKDEMPNHPVEVIKEESDHIDKLVRQATTLDRKTGDQGQVTFLTRGFGRGIDFVCMDKKVLDDEQHGVQVIQTFLSEMPSEEIQVKGRTARQGKHGSFSMILCQPDMKKQFPEITPEQFSSMRNVSEGPNSVYGRLSSARDKKYKERIETLMEKVEKAKVNHQTSINFMDKLVSFKGDNTQRKEIMDNLIKFAKRGLADIPRPTSFFIVMCLDESGSMINSWEQLKQAVDAFVDNRLSSCEKTGFPCQDELHIVSYSGDAWYRGKFELKRKISAQALLRYRGGGTDFGRGLNEANRVFGVNPNGSGRSPVLVFMSDGVSHNGEAEMKNIFAQWSPQNLQVFVLGFSSGCNQQKLQNLAQLGKGTYSFGADGASLKSGFEAVASRLSGPLVRS